MTNRSAQNPSAVASHCSGVARGCWTVAGSRLELMRTRWPRSPLSMIWSRGRFWDCSSIAGKPWVLQKLATSVVNPTCSDVVTKGQVGELFLQVLNDVPLFYKVTLSSPPASQLFGGIPNPDEEVRLWKSFRLKLESAMTLFEKRYIASTCLNLAEGLWTKNRE